MADYKIPEMLPIKEVNKRIPGTSYEFIRQLCLRNKIVYIRSGSKYLINFQKFVDFLNGERS